MALDLPAIEHFNSFRIIVSNTEIDPGSLVSLLFKQKNPCTDRPMSTGLKVLRYADWSISPANPFITLIGQHFPPVEHREDIRLQQQSPVAKRRRHRVGTYRSNTCGAFCFGQVLVLAVYLCPKKLQTLPYFSPKTENTTVLFT